jgi:pyrroloquinoline quinone biosynthesis protein D
MTDTSPLPLAAEPLSQRLRLNPHYLLRYEYSQQAHILLYPEGLIKLNQAAAQILQRCDGTRTVQEVIADLDVAFPGNLSAIAQDTQAFVATALQKGWLRQTTEKTTTATSTAT